MVNVISSFYPFSHDIALYIRGGPLTRKTGNSGENISDGKVREIHEKLPKSGENEIVSANV